jgi:hypothetical protein
MLTGIPPVAEINRAHRHPTCRQTKNHLHRLRTSCIPRTKPTRPSYLTRSKPTITQLIMWKVHVAHDREHGYHDSLHFVDVAQLYPQVSNFIIRRWLRVSILPNIHFLRCTTRRSPQSLPQCFLARKTFTLRFHRYGSHILQRPPLVPRLGDKRTPSPKSRKSHPVLLPRISAKLGKQHIT